MSLDRVGQWSRNKLGMLAEYLHAYAVIMNAQKRSWLTAFHYIDAFAGPGIAEFRGKADVIEYLKGSPVRALECSPRFDHLWFMDRNKVRAGQLHALLVEHDSQDRAAVMTPRDSNPKIRDLVGRLDTTERALVFLDPYGQVQWETVRALGQNRKVDVFINFSLMGVIRNLRRREGPTPAFRERLRSVMISDSWVDELYVEQGSLIGSPVKYRTQLGPQKVAQRYSHDLSTVFDYISNTAIMRNSTGGAIYALMLASHNNRAAAIMNDIIRKYGL